MIPNCYLSNLATHLPCLKVILNSGLDPGCLSRILDSHFSIPDPGAVSKRSRIRNKF
jgi:hypothetical protein